MSRWQKIAAASCAFMAVLTGMVLFTRSANRRAWEACRAELIGRGETLDATALLPALPPAAENFGATPYLAAWCDYTFDPVTQEPIRRPYTGKLMPSLRLSPAGKRRLPAEARLLTNCFTDFMEWHSALASTNAPIPTSRPEAAEACLTLLAPGEPVRDELIQALPRPHARFLTPPEPRPPWNRARAYPIYGPFRYVQQWLSLHAAACFATGRTEDGCNDILLKLRLVECWLNEDSTLGLPAAVSQLAVTLATLREGLARHAFTTDQLARLEQSLASLKLIDRLPRAARTSRATAITGIEWVQRPAGPPGTDLAPHLGAHFGGTAGASVRPLTLLARGLNVPDSWKVTVCRRFDGILLPLVSPHGTWSKTSFDRAIADIRSLRPTPGNLITSSVGIGTVETAQRTVAMAAWVDLARWACAVERYRLEQHQLPATLLEAEPFLTGDPPRDLVTGNPLRFDVKEGNYRIWSLAWNELDDGGTLGNLRSLHWSDWPAASDWVWNSRLEEPPPLQAKR